MINQHTQKDFFTIYRCLVCIINQIRPLDLDHKKWIHHSLQKYPLNLEQIKLIENEFTQPSDYALLYSSIANPYDRQKIIDLVEIIFKLDDHLSSHETQILKTIKEINVNLKSQDQHLQQQYGQELIDLENRKIMYEDLQEFSKIISYRPNSFLSILGFNGYTWRALFFGNKFYFWFVIIFFIIVTLIRIIVQLMR